MTAERVPESGPDPALRRAPAPAVVFDVMDTLLTDPYRAAHEAATGLTFAAFEQRRPAGVYHALERGEIDEPAYWRALRAAGIDVDVDSFHGVRVAGYAWLAGMRRLLLDVAAASRVLLATNYPLSWVRDLHAMFFSSMGVEICSSAEVGARKPSPEFFARMAALHSLDPASTLLIDNAPVNVCGAVNAGWRGEVFRDAASAREKIWGHLGRVRELDAGDGLE